MKTSSVKTQTADTSNFAISSNQLIVITCVYLSVVLNYPFLKRVFNAVLIEPEHSLLFMFTVPVLLTSLFVFINSILSLGKALKPVLIITLMASSCIFYATTTYGTVFDYSMVQNGFETDGAEAFSYINLYSVGFIFLFGVMPSLLVFNIKITEQGFVNMLIARARLVAISTVVIGITSVFFYANYAAVGRNNSELQVYITPYKFVDSALKYINRNYYSAPLAFKLLDRYPSLETTTTAPVVTVLVIGETARAQSFSLNGYAKQTNLYTDKLDVLSFTDMASCGTATAVSLPCMFSRLNRAEFEKREASYQQNLLDIISLAGADVLWIDNNNGGCKGVCSRVNTISIETTPSNPLCDTEYCLDEALLQPLNEKLNNLTHPHALIVLHMMGSHGPTYFKRYPKDKAVFTPDCPRSDIQHCSEEQLINTYDNTIAYTDFVLSQIIGALQHLETKANAQTAMLYVSDHGESLGEKGMYLHGLPYAFAPSEQTHIPMLYWQAQSKTSEDMNCLKALSTEFISHDNVFDIVMGITAVDSKVYQRQQDTFANCRATDGLAAREQTETDIQASEAIN
ncbi:phosphoethanolamine transferase [Glaciecola sp. SC05]|uniref:phosphoethanolamine transferase n=1 Tax=Glaciecola sp. SC05 TaxID=1987355 RepID=UPI0035277331